MKPRLIIISDLWGTVASNWIACYREYLSDAFEIYYYDARVIAGIGLETLSEQEIHAQFIGGGIDIAVEQLLQQKTESQILLAFSIGGTIAWKAALKGLKAHSLYLVSSTRLRYESQKPNGNIQLLYAEKDAFRPEAKWFLELGLDCEIIKGATHDIYRSADFAKQITERIILDYKNANA